ncbi:MAG: NAD(P)/FAD-dependent oxidoreductase [Planctomycetota bacterium]|nr:MAG: NAD(P)/FAD-dependent oxidoreductase [Planctomycetota bacterium]REK24413.1 MAG: NAD(P)/FAD-dependent oxidoreductase [Planctomycetota bacterium]REK38601.1 MAG: NAD(P)/FAD-dependent oxidoreductase [Planctomycetota bacterium]
MKPVLKCDLLVIGTGPAASRVANRCAAEGWEVAIAEKREFGGTCALRGCNPKKVYVRAAELCDWIRRGEGTLIRTSSAHIDWPQLVAFKRSFTDGIPEQSEAGYRKKGMTTLHGAARFVSPREVQVGEQRVAAEKVLIASGARPATLDFPGSEHLVTSDEFMELDELPPRVLFVGGGYVSFEFAHVALRAGAQVAVVEQESRVLRPFAASLVERLAAHSRELGMTIHTGTPIESIEKTESGALRVQAEGAGGRETFDVDLVVHGAGRAPNLDGMDLAAGEVESTEAGVSVDEFMQSTSNPAVFAAGDCAASGAAPLTPTANAEGHAIARTLLEGIRCRPDYGPVPAAVFTVPALASVGLSREAAEEQKLDFTVEAGDMSDWSSMKKVSETCAAYEVLVDKPSGRILGAHLLGPEAAETINLFALAMKFGLTAKDVKSVLMAFPTFASDVRSMV